MYELLQFKAENAASIRAEEVEASRYIYEHATGHGNEEVIETEPTPACGGHILGRSTLDNFDPVLPKELFAQVVAYGGEILRTLNVHGIQYVPEGGSFIGLVRHQGMIPWDDDGDFYLQKNETSIRAMLLEVLPKLMSQGFEVRMDIPVKTYKLSYTKDPNKFKYFKTRKGLLKNHGGWDAISDRSAPLPNVNYFKIRHLSWGSNVYFEFRTYCDSADGRHVILKCDDPWFRYKMSSRGFYPLQHLPWHNVTMMAPADLAVYWAQGCSKTTHITKPTQVDNHSRDLATKMYGDMLSTAYIEGSGEHDFKWKRKAETRELAAISYLACYDPKHYEDTLPWRNYKIRYRRGRKHWYNGRTGRPHQGP